MQVSESLLASYHLDNGNIVVLGAPGYDPTGSNYVDWLNKLQLDASWGDLTAQLRIDSALFANAPVAAETDPLWGRLQNRYGNRLDFEKVFLAYSSRHFDVTLGDTYATYGRGLVLSLRKVDEFGIDTSVRGLSATGRVGGLTVNALGGWSNIVNVDPASGRGAENPNDAILGGRAEYRIGKWVTPGIDFSHVIYANSSQPNTSSVSGTLEFPHLWSYGTFYVEFARQYRLTPVSPTWSRAFYASGSAYLGPLTLLLEYKDYHNYSSIPTSLDQTAVLELALNDFYTAAPTLERVQQLVLNNTDVAGGHLRASLKLRPFLVPFVSMAYFVDHTYNSKIYDPYAGAELHWNEDSSRASLSGGYRRNQYDDSIHAVAPGKLFETEWHLEYDINQHVKGPYSVELSGLHVIHRDRDQRGTGVYIPWDEGQAYLSFKRADDWSVAIGYEYYTKTPGTLRTHYPNASASWQILKNLLVRLLVGGQRAGIKCVSGVCRNYPAFDGARLEVVAKY